MATPLLSPRDGLPELCTTPAQFEVASARLAQGVGPIAIDTERASGFRYDDRAFLIQIRRRNVGTLLIAPEGHRPEVTKAFSSVLNGEEWVIHAAHTDLPSLALLGFYPGSLFDTELAGRLAGFDHVNLAAMTADVLGYQLAKGHGGEDWSTTPLPHDWLEYAALDVELLLELADAMAEILDSQGKLEWASQEFQHVVESFGPDVDKPPATWRDTKGIGVLAKSEQLNIAKALWKERERIASSSDRAVSAVLRNRLLVDIARAMPRSQAELAKISGFPHRNPHVAKKWFRVIQQARAIPKTEWPRRQRSSSAVPARQSWSSQYPEAFATLTEVKEVLEEVGLSVDIPLEHLVQPAVLRTLVWEATEGHQINDAHDLAQAMEDLKVRPWQIDLSLGPIAKVLFG